MEFSGQYLTYQEYKGLGGTLDQMPFNLLEFEARKNIDKYTFNRLQDLQAQSQETKMCIYKLINVINSYDGLEGHNKAITSENIDGYSVSYASTSNNLAMAKETEIEGIVREYLIHCKLDDGTPYMYRGVDAN